MSKKVGAVLVIGGGIGGIQATLDLAEQGFKVYLVERYPSVGGVMAQLDKTFPTNDCAMCTLAPKLVEVGRHPNVTLITHSELEEIEGEAGNFRVLIKQHSPYVDFKKCTGCGECERVCPVELRSEFNEGLDNIHAIYRLYPQAIPNVYAIKKIKGKPPCRLACPAGVNPQAYIQLIARGRFEEALSIIRTNNPFPAVCGRVCHHPCEEECLRGEVDEPLAIRALKRFVAELDSTPPEVKELTKDKIAIVGGGPAGLTAAHDLLQLGYRVTIFEKEKELGGMMRYGIPPYRLPRDVLQREVNRIVKMGAEVKLNTEVGKDLSLKDLKKEGFKAILISIGAQLGKALRIEGAELQSVYIGIPFLRRLERGEKFDFKGRRILVVGGGGVAIDCARCALRMGAKEVHIACLESFDEMPAHRWEVEEAVEEGVVIHTRIGPKRILSSGDGVVRGVEFLRVSAVFDSAGKFNPTFIPNSEHQIQCDNVIIAIGQVGDTHLLKEKEEGIFAAGDIITGPSSVVEAIAQGHEVAASIDRYLKGEKIDSTPKKEEKKISSIWHPKVEKVRREAPERMSPQKRIKGFDEIERTFKESHALKEAGRCLSCSICCECLRCVEACKAEAINHQMEDRVIELQVGSIILTQGFRKFDPSKRSEYGYGRYKNVITSLEFERILSASGPTGGHLSRPSDKAEPKRIAFIQCVGSRDREREFCSTVCCMYATKEAIIAKEHATNELKCDVFFMDIRAYGKGFEEYYRKAKEAGVNYIRARPSSIDEVSESKNLKIRYEREDGEIAEGEYELVVLSIGLEGEKDGRFERLGIAKNHHGFIKTSALNPIDTNIEGIFVSGCASSPKDIPETICEASGAAARAASLLREERGTQVRERILPQELPVEGAPRVGVFVCHCGVNIAGIVNVEEVAEYARSLDGVVYAECNLYTCSQDTQEKIKEKIKEHKLNRVVVASCTPRTHQPMFQETIREAGLNKYLFEMANIRDQCSWVHRDDKKAATEKAKVLVRMAVTKAKTLQPLQEAKSKVNPKALVIGGGVTGLTASLSLSAQGFYVHLIEKEGKLGGGALALSKTLSGEDVRDYLNSLIKEVEENNLISVYKGVELLDVKGYVGNFKTCISDGEKIMELEHGVIIVATGAKEYKPKEYLYGEDSRVLTQHELDELLKDDKLDGNCNTIVMIQCVGSRTKERMYCSRVCCAGAIRNALQIKRIKPSAEVYILYRDIRTFGLREEFYKRARLEGINFIRYDEDRKPEVRERSGRLELTVFDPILKENLLINPDLIVLSSAIIPNESEQLAKMLKIPLTQDGFFLEAHIKLRPVDFSTPGIFVAGLAHSPKGLEECIVQAQAAAGRAATLLSKTELLADGAISTLRDETLCRGCEKCVDVCEFGAIEMVEYAGSTKIARINPILCKGCGACAARCQAGAITPLHFETSQINAMVEAALK